MRHEIIISNEANKDLDDLNAFYRTIAKDRIEKHLRYEPTKESGKIKKLEEPSNAQYRLKNGILRTYYDVDGNDVKILAIIKKPKSNNWLKNKGETT